MRKRFFLTVCALLCALLFTGAAAFASDSPMAELHLEKNGLPLDVTLRELSIEDGELTLTIGLDGIAGWKNEEPPRLIVVCADPRLEYKLDLCLASTVKELPDSAKSFKTSPKLPYSGTELPEQLLIDIGGKEPLILWEKNPSPAATDAPAAQIGPQAALDRARELIDKGEYYKAALALLDCENEFPSTREDCGELMDRISLAAADREPVTGELERHFPYFGANVVRVTAKTAPFEMTITDAEDSSQFVRFYVRKGDTSEIYLPSSHYHVFIRMGEIWFDNEVGFGEFCESSDFGGDTLDMTSGVKGTTMNWHEWTQEF